MRPLSKTVFLLLILLVSFPLSAQAFWWGSEQDNTPALNLESGYDVNTVTTVTGQILSLQSSADRPNLQLEIEDSGTRMVVFLGPRRYWADQGMPLQVGDKVTVRGSKAQGQDGVIYILAQEISVVSQGIAVILRDESGHPNWGGGSSESNGHDDGKGDGGGRGNGGGAGGGHGGGGGR
jgi:uncharacterized membrane protein YgcG